MSENPDRPWMDAAQPVSHRVALLVEAMTLEEKVDLMTGDMPEGVEGFGNAGIDRLGIPPLRMADAGSGIRRARGHSASTGFPAPLAIAATWDRQIAVRYGETIGEECYLLRHNVLLGPNADLARVPWWGRIGESAGEDPYLAAELAKVIPAAVQRPGVMATYKHPLAYTQETNRGIGSNSIIDDRTAREIYAPAFQAAIQGGAVAMMSSFNKINGVFACENDAMQNKLLRDSFGFQGFLMADFLANHSMSPANGLDMETPGHPVEPTFYGENLVWAVRSGSVSESVLDRACSRILWAMFTTGLLDTPLPAADQPVPYAAHAAISRQLAEAGVTLLENDGGILPLDPGQIRSIAVIGADSDIPSQLGGSSFITIPSDAVGILRGITERAPDHVEVRSAPGTDRIASGDGIFLGAPPIPSAFVTAPGGDGAHGVRVEYFTAKDLVGEPFIDRVEPDATFNAFGVFNAFHDQARIVIPTQAWSLRVTADLTVPATGEYAFTLAGWGEAKLWFDDLHVAQLDSPGIQSLVTSRPFTWTAGETHALRLEFRATGSRPGGLEPGAIQLGWTHPDSVISPDVLDAAELARRSDVAVVCVRTSESEQQDAASLTLPRDQDTLVRAVAAANAHTVVVLSTGTPVLMPWTPDVAAIVQSYFGGQEQGHAVASILFGDVNPSGKLPYTIPLHEDQYQTIGITNPVHNERNLDVQFLEGLHLGYRGFDKHGLEPRYPFGHGLSYTRFDYDDLSVSPTESDGTAPVTVNFTLVNEGTRAGAEVCQVYLEAPAGHGEPPRKLVGFQKVTLEPGERRNVTIQVDPFDVTHPLALWDSGSRLWQTIGGAYSIHVGASSRDLRLTGSFQISPPVHRSQPRGQLYGYASLSS